MTPEEAAAVLHAGPPPRKRRPTLSEEERRRVVTARGRAVNKARQALVNLHREDFDALYKAACAEEGL